MDATFWALMSLIVFLGILFYFKVPGMMTKALDDRSDQIRNELSEARRLREEAQRMLGDYQKKTIAAREEAEEIRAAAQREADALVLDAERKTAEYVERRTALAEQKIGQAESQAVAEVKAAAVDLAVAATRRLLDQKVTGQKQSALFKDSLEDVRRRMN